MSATRKKKKKARGKQTKKRATATRAPKKKTKKKRALAKRAKKLAPARRKKKAGPPRKKVRGGTRRGVMRALPLARTLSGAGWVAQFPGSRSTTDLTPAFRAAVDAFIAAIRAAGASVQISSTFRPPERAYLMHFSWLIAQGQIDEHAVPAKNGVDIEWAHPTPAASVAAAKAMVQGYGLVHVAALTSRHTEARAIDMSISWNDDLAIRTADGATRVIASTPRDGTNTELHAVGQTYGVVKLLSDPPHWSEDGH